MAEVTVKQLAQVVNIPVEKLLEQLQDAGVKKDGELDLINDAEKGMLLTHLQQSRTGGKAATGTPVRKTLRRKNVSEMKSAASGKSKVSVEVKRKRLVRTPVAEEKDTSPAVDEAPEKDLDAQRDDDTDTAVEAAKPSADTSTSEAVAGQTDPTPSTAEIPDSEDLPETEASTAAADAETAAEIGSAEQEIEDQLNAQVSKTAAELADNPEPQAAAEVAEEEVSEPTTIQRKLQQSQELEKKRISAVEQQQSQDTARLAAEQQAMRQVAREKRRESEEQLQRDREERQKQRELEDAQRRAALEAQEVSKEKSTRKDSAGGGKGRGRSKPSNDTDTRYGRNQLHVAKGKSGKRKGKARRAVPANLESKHTFEKPTAPVVRDVAVPETITVAELGNKMAVKAGEVIKSMMGMGVMATINQLLDQDTAILVVEEMGHRATPVGHDDIEAALAQELSGTDFGEKTTRPPVITVMGHVDHGKTSLLDYIRESRVASGEAGGITQHIGAYHVDTENGMLTFLDTPGHAAFTAMRARGAQATDIVVLVVAADDGVMPQTIEGIQHARAAGVPLVVAVNKMDKEDADPERVRNELSQHDVISEAWGGDTLFVPVSALTGDGIDELLEGLLLQTELLELTANHDGNASGLVIEASLEKGRGPVATVLVQNGTLRKGDIIICGQETGRVRAMFNESGEQVDSAGPSIPVQILGLSAAPNAGDEMLVAEDERRARELAELRHSKQRDARLAERKPARLEDVFSQITSGDMPTLNLVVKADVKGSFEAIRDSLEKLSTDEVGIRVVGGGVGGITESDANLAAASNAILVGFNVRADGTARKLVTEHDIDLRYYSVIYDLIDLVKQVAGGMLPPEIKERIIGLAEVKDVFKSPKFGQIAGCMVVDGVVRRDEPIRVLRDNVVIFEGELESLRRFKDDVKDVNMGTECGIGVKNYTDVKSGDQIEVFERTEVARTL